MASEQPLNVQHVGPILVFGSSAESAVEKRGAGSTGGLVVPVRDSIGIDIFMITTDLTCDCLTHLTTKSPFLERTPRTEGSFPGRCMKKFATSAPALLKKWRRCDPIHDIHDGDRAMLA